MSAPMGATCHLFIRRRITKLFNNIKSKEKQYILSRSLLFESIVCTRSLTSRNIKAEYDVRKLVTVTLKRENVEAYNARYLHTVLNSKYNDLCTRKTANLEKIGAFKFNKYIHLHSQISQSKDTPARLNHDSGNAYVDHESTAGEKDVNEKDSTNRDLVHQKCLNSKCNNCAQPHVVCNSTPDIDDKVENRNEADALQPDPWKEQVKGFKEDIRTIPNLLTLSRVLVAPVLGYLVTHDHYTWAFGIFIYAGISDVLDGFIARRFVNQQSVLGAAFDPLADKLLISVLVISLTSAGLLPGLLTGLIIGRDIGLVAAGFYLRYLSLPQPKTMSRYFDVTLPTAQLYPTNLSKVNTGLQLMLVALTLSAPVFDFINHPYLQALWYITGTTTILSAIGYMVHGKECVRMIKESKS